MEIILLAFIFALAAFAWLNRGLYGMWLGWLIRRFRLAHKASDHRSGFPL